VGSSGKAFSLTGWKTGWSYGPANLMKNLFVAHQVGQYQIFLAFLTSKNNILFY
jgi:aspartate/methionine/tyrosine aminotransferase